MSGGRAAWTGKVERDDLVRLVAEGRTVRAIAIELGVSYTTVRHWMGRYGLQTARGRRLAQTRPAREAGTLRTIATCEIHADTELIARPDGGFRCHRCRNEAVIARRRRVKAALVAEAGGACACCGYSRAVAALQFHHLDPASKEFSIAASGKSRSLERARAEAAKCILLCANCHAEVEVGVRQVPLTGA